MRRMYIAAIWLTLVFFGCPQAEAPEPANEGGTVLWAPLAYPEPAIAVGTVSEPAIAVGTVLWAPLTYTDVQLKCVAENYASVNLSGGVRGSEIAAVLHGHNAEIKTFGYVNSRYVPDNDYWNMMWRTNPQLFAVDEAGRRIKNRHWNLWLMDVGNQEWWQIIVDHANNLSPHLDGIFLDNASPMLNLPMHTAPPNGYDPVHYAETMKDFIREIKASYLGLVVFNGLRKAMDVDGYAAVADGALIEGFIFSERVQSVNEDKIRGDIEAVLKAKELDGFLIGVGVKGYMRNIQKRMFAYGCYMMVYRPEGMSYGFMDIDRKRSESLQFYPEYEIRLGHPIDEPRTIQEMLEPETGLVMRRFEHGVVVVNPRPENIEFIFNGAHQRAILRSGGVVKADGTYGGWLEFEEVPSPMVVEGRSAVVLVRR